MFAFVSGLGLGAVFGAAVVTIIYTVQAIKEIEDAMGVDILPDNVYNLFDNTTES